MRRKIYYYQKRCNNCMNHQKEAVNKLKKKCGKEAYILESIDNDQWKYIENSKDSHCVLMKNPYLSKDIILFGFIDFPDDVDISKDLFKKIEEAAKSFSGKKLIGPINYSTWFTYRWMTQGFKEKRIYKEPSNPEYFVDAVKKMGFKEYKIYLSNLVKSNDSKHSIYKKRYEDILEKEYYFKKYTGLKIFFALKNMYDISIDSFVKNPLYSPIRYDAFKKIYVSGFNKVTKLYASVDLCFYKKEPVGFLFTFKNPFTQKIYVWKTIGIKKAFQKQGIGSAFRYIAHKTALENECNYICHHLTYEDNIVKKLRNSNDKIFKKYALFYKDL